LLQRVGEPTFEKLLGDHRDILRTAVSTHGGIEVGTEGDGCRFAFDRASAAVAAAVDAQLALASQAWPAGDEVKVRMGIHAGEARLDGDRYVGPVVGEAEAIATTGHGGQVVISSAAKLVLETVVGEVALVALGWHGVGDQAAPVELFQLTHPRLPSAFPALRSVPRAGRTLPFPSSPFLGRQRELADGAVHLADHRLVTVVGPGGIGKTRLALELAGAAVADVGDGVWVVPLAGLSRQDMVAGAVSAVVSMAEDAGGETDEASVIVRHLGDRRSLLVLDNCEHVADAAASLVDALLAGCPGLRVLATSREPLRVPGEFVWSIPPLDVPEGEAPSLDVLAASDGVRLFAERAAQADGRFVLSADNASDVLTICRRLDGMPLAIELAAARAPTLTPGQIAQRLDRSLDLLSRGPRTADARQSTLRGAIAWSEELLDDVHRRLFARLSVFRGTFDLEDVEAVCGQDIDDPIDVLSDLVDKSLVALRPRGSAMEYSMLQTIAAYAAESLLRSGDSAAMHARHFRHFAAVAAAGAAAITEGSIEGLSAALERLEAKHDNIRAALGWALEHADADEAIDLALSAVRFWDRKAYFREGRRWLDAVLERGGSPTMRCQALHTSAAMSTRLGDNRRAAPQLAEAYGLALELGHDDVAMFAALELGTIDLDEGRTAEAEAWYLRVEELARKIGAVEEVAGATLNRGLVRLQMGDLDAAAALVDDALAAARRVDAGRVLTSALLAAGTIAIHRADMGAARLNLEEALRLTRLSGDEFALVFVANDLAEVLRHEGEVDRAVDLYRECVAWCRAAGAVRNASLVLLSLSVFMAEYGSVDDSIVLLGATDALNTAAAIALDPFQDAAKDTHTSELRTRSEPDAFEARTSEGAALSTAEALDRADRWLVQTFGPPDTASDPSARR
jgi:predicted ATPase